MDTKLEIPVQLSKNLNSHSMVYLEVDAEMQTALRQGFVIQVPAFLIYSLNTFVLSNLLINLYMSGVNQHYASY